MSEYAATEADAYEQQRPVLDPDEGTLDDADEATEARDAALVEPPLDVNEADLVEQEAPVPLDEDDYR